MTEKQTQIIGFDTFVGIKRMVAPGGWQFTKVDKLLWSALCRYTQDRRRDQKRKRDEYVLDGQIEALSKVLANSLGMSSHYWIIEARRLCDAEVGG